MDSQAEVQLDPRLRVRLDRLGVAALVVTLVIEFLPEFLVTQRVWQVVVLKPGVEAAANLFHGEVSLVLFVQRLAKATA